MTDIIKYYPITLEESNYKDNFELLRKKKWKCVLDRNLENKIDIINLCDMVEYFDKNKFIHWDKFVIPKNISDVMNKNIICDMNIFDFIPTNFVFDIKYSYLYLRCIHKLNNIFGFEIDINDINLTKILFEEIMPFFNRDCNGRDIECILNSTSTHEQFKSIKTYLIYSKNFKDAIIFNKYMLFVLTDNYILILPNIKSLDNYSLIINGKVYLKIFDKELVIRMKKEYIYTKTKNKIIWKNYGYVKNSTETEIFNFSTDNEFVIKKIFDYTNKDTKLKIKSNNTFFTKQNIQISKYTENKCEVEEYLNLNTNYKYVRSECMIPKSMITDNMITDFMIGNGNNNEDSGLRFRGKFTQSSSNGKNIKKTINIGDKIIYDKEGEETRTDLLVDKKKYLNRKEIIIGYKVAKSANGELRVIKLGITTDAQIAIPIDEHYFINYCKERCNKAIVMDIQLPIKNEEISVVPNEIVAYSYIFKSGKNDFNYKVGTEVIPDSFNPDEDIGCANGIHYFQSRENLFEAYID
jgi:hypothetical protein